jgi:DNA repair protein RecO (recombination protein O)
MSRSFIYSALILRVRSSGESNREAWFLTAEEGIIRATSFGGPKSKLRAHISPFHSGTLWVYHDPVKDSRKVTDFDVHSWRPGIRECYERVQCASSLLETILATQGGGGNWKTALALANSALEALAGADAMHCTPIMVHFLWNWALFLGVAPELEHCASCACPPSADGLLWFSKRDGVLLCSNCAHKHDAVPIYPGARRWLAAVENLAPDRLLRYTLEKPALVAARFMATHLLAGVLGRWLSSWESL